MRRQRWEAVHTSTGKVVSAPYYNCAAAKRVAQTAANKTGDAHEVTRNYVTWVNVYPEVKS